nr:hypothetical protein [Tanacetum cinerariifolium]
MGFLTAKGRWSGNSVKEKGLSMDDGRDMVNGGEAFGFVTSNVASNGMDVHIPKESVSILNERFNNIIYEFFQDMHFFKFGSKEGIKAMLKSSSWLIHNVPLILKQWTSDANIIKADVWNIPVSVKFHDVPITAFTEDQLSAITSKLDSPLMLDSYTAAMCTDSWGRASYDRAIIKLKVDNDFRDTIIVVVPKYSHEGFTTSTIRVIYE